MEILSLIILTLSLFLGIYFHFRNEVFYQKHLLNIFNWVYLVEIIIMGALFPYFIYSIRNQHWSLKFIPIDEFPFVATTLALAWAVLAFLIVLKLTKYIFNKYNFKLELTNFINKPLD